MRKLIWLALAIGAAELFKREAVKRGLSPSQLLANLAENTFYRNKGEAPPA
jgi:hypothetical protein